MDNNLTLGTWLANNIIEEANSNITTIVAIYPGRFQPMGKHHAQAYKWLKSKFKDAYVATSDKVQLPKSPFSFNDKKKIISSYGIKNVVKVKNPYKAEEILKKYDPETTAAVFMIGEKDQQRLGGKFFRPWKGKAEVGYKEGAYTIIAPHVSLKVPGYGEMSGTAIRTALGAPTITDGDRARLFKHIFGHMKNYKLITNKLNVNESIGRFIDTGAVTKIISEMNTTGGAPPVDDGPQGWYGRQSAYKGATKQIADKMGWQIINYLSGEEEVMLEPSRYRGDTRSPSFFPAGVPGVTTPSNPKDYTQTKAYSAWRKFITKIARVAGMEFLNFLDADTSKKGKTPTGEKVKEPNKVDKNPNTVKEDITIPIKVGDTILGGKFKNKRIVVKTISKNEKGDILINGRPLLKYRLVNEGLLLEGGAYGHMSHPFDDKNLTFGDFKNIIKQSLQGNIDLESAATEKTDGQNLFITWDGELKAARNSGDLKRGGMDSKAVAKKFLNRGNIEKAFNYAMNDLSKAIGKLSDKQKLKIFNNGNNWVNMEIMYPASANVISYDAPYLQFHNVLMYKDGKAVGSVSDGARMLAGMIKQINSNMQKSFSIIGPKVLKVNPHQDFSDRQDYFLKKLQKLQSKFSMSDSNTLNEYHQAWWEAFIDKKFKKANPTIKRGLVTRWAFNDKSYRLDKKNIEDETLLAAAKEFDKQKHVDQVKKNMFPFETLFFELGAEVLKNVEGFLAVNPAKAVQNVRKQVAKAITDVRGGGDIKKMNRLVAQLKKIKAIGGFKTIIPSEGLVFIYKGNTYKLTGSFGPVNQIAGMMTF
jgi:hypothetical protein